MSVPFFAGVSRLTISLTVIMLELTGSLTHLLPLMTAIMTAKRFLPILVSLAPTQ